MPRVTRAQLRAQEAEGGPQNIHEDVHEARAISSREYTPCSTESSGRPPLGEIRNNNNNNNTPAPDSDRRECAVLSKSTSESKHGIASQTGHMLADNENSTPRTEREISEDKRRRGGSPAVEVAETGTREDATVPQTFQEPTESARPKTPLSVAATASGSPLNRSPDKKSTKSEVAAVKTPRFDPAIHASTSSTGRAAERGRGDSFVGSIKTRTPARIVTSKEHTGDGPESFVEDIVSRSPSERMARIEDSVEAMDALEEAIEQVSEELPRAMSNNLESPVKTRTPRVTTAKPSPKQLTSSTAASAKQTSKRPTPTTRSASAVKNSAPTISESRKPPPRVSSIRPQPRRSTLTNTNTKSLSPPQLAASAAKAEPSQATASTIATNRRTTSTNLSTSKPGFVPNKSAKPLTKSIFSLPGDAIAAKMKAQREERLEKEKAEAEAAARKRTEFKARPVPKTMTAGSAGGKARVSSVLPRETVASRARMSLMAAKKDEDGKENAGLVMAAKKLVIGSGVGSTRVLSAARKSVVPSNTTAPSGLSIPKTRRAPPSAASANVVPTDRANKKSTVPANSSAVRRNTATTYPSASRTTDSSLRPIAATGLRFGSDRSANTRKTTTVKAVATSTATVTIPSGTVKGREVFSRGKLAEEDLLKQKRDKEETAKKARAEASERGRLASREWAERQKKRKTMTTMVVEKGETANLNAAGKVEGGKDGEVAQSLGGSVEGSAEAAAQTVG